MDEPFMKIGEIAAFFHVSVKAIRVYEKKGILVPARIDSDTGYRYYTVDQVQTLNALIELKTLGFSLSEIKGILSGDMESDQLLTSLSKKSIAWQESISSAKNKIEAIEKIAQRIAVSKGAKKITALTDEQRAWLLVKMVCVEDVRSQSTLTEAIWL